jgi:hypothetical protein
MLLWIILTYLTSSVLVVNPYDDEDEIDENWYDLLKTYDIAKTLLVGVLLISVTAKIFD